ncbi:MAG: hypothetical protein Q6370_014405 [Candidatus Sigynarchaeota archaeon]|jgi:hypothetical protein
MPMQPTKYEYTPPVQIAGMAKDFTSKIEIAQTAAGWVATCHITSSPLDTSNVAQGKLREHLLRLAEELSGSAK